MGRGDQAETDLRSCLQLNPGSPEVRALLADRARDRGIRSGEHFRRRVERLDTSSGLRRILHDLIQPTAAVEKLPAATVAVGWSSREEEPTRPSFHGRAKLAEGTSPEAERPASLKRPKVFGAYLLLTGQLSELQLHAALAYHRDHGVRLGAAVVALGFLTEPTVERAADSFHERRKKA